MDNNFDKKKNEQRLQFVLENDIKRELTTPHSSSQEHTLHDDGTVGRRNTAVLWNHPQVKGCVWELQREILLCGYRWIFTLHIMKTLELSYFQPLKLW